MRLVLLTVLAVSALSAEDVPCDRSRKVLTKPWGIISDGPSGTNYTQDSHCQWLIKANSTKQFITLKFLSMGTECSYDYVYIYDGDSFKSPMLGSFSGKTVPQEVVATSGFMLVLLYSDANYVLDGFRAEYSISECLGNCSGRGTCVAHSCVCESEWAGPDCSVSLCPNACSANNGGGVCARNGSCLCYPGRSGVSCSLDVNDVVGNKWHKLYSGGIKARAAHSAVYLKETDSLYVFGGYDLNYVLGDLVVFRFQTSRWEDEEGNVSDNYAMSASHLDSEALQAVVDMVGGTKEEGGVVKPKTFLLHALLSLTDNSTLGLKLSQADISRRHSSGSQGDKIKEQSETLAKPTPRYSHAAAPYNGGFALYGGRLKNGTLSDELWFYDVTIQRWSQRDFSDFRPPALARHTMTLAHDNWLYVVGGSRIDGSFSDQVYRIKLREGGGDEIWEHVNSRGGKSLDVRLVGHTTVYSDILHSLIVYGGVATIVARFSKLSDRMFSFDLDSRTWTQIHYPRATLRDTFVPSERAFHTSTTIGNYIVVFGGYTHRHNKEEICYDNQLYLYHLGCHTWVSHEILGSASNTSRYPKRQGVFAHAAALRNGNTLLIFGGYHGNVNADLLAYTLPPTLASKEGELHEAEQMCTRHHGLSECTSDPECGWCSADEICYGRTLGVNCTTNLQTTRCPGICPALSHCHACLLHGYSHRKPPDVRTSVAHKLSLSHCSWCVQNAKCHHIHDNFGVCGVREDTPSQVPGWWGDKGVEVTQAADCKALDRRPGLTFITYKHPANLSQPDYVSIINATSVDFNDGATRPEQALGGVVTVRLRGFLRPPTNWINEQLRMCISSSSATLYFALNHSNVEIVGNASTETSLCREAQWPSGGPTILPPGRHSVDFQSRKKISSESYPITQHSKMELQHKKTLENHSKVFTFEYLEPFEGGELCSSYSNCLACLTDSKCGWCPLKNTCMDRAVNETNECRLGNVWHYLTLVPNSCSNCTNYITCESCINTNFCEWWADDARCYRIGRSQRSIRTVDKCPTACHLRTNCSQCLDGFGKCVWCQATHECFSFSVYTSQYQFGLCREWSDAHDSGILPPSSNSAGSGIKGSTRNIITMPQACQPCSRHENCSECLKSLGCGWCYDVDNPILGVCAPGDFTKPHVESCSGEVNAYRSTSLYPDEAAWSYAQCPDVDECGLSLHDCHKQAKCTNTHGSYNCQCKRGYIGDGKITCAKTCYNKCVNGYCSGAPDYVCNCNLGWTGVDCSVNCGCNNHSTCTKGVNICDSCQNWTTGEFCQICKPGSYGNATSPEGCKRCNCNEHGSEELGVCNSHTGLCFCQDNTEGATCDKCKRGYYGDPRRGGTCYYQCMSRGMVSSVETQGLGSRLAEMSVWESRQGAPPTRECLWIVRPDKLANSSSANSIVQLEIDKDIDVKCTENSVYVYDGLPKFVSSSGTHQSHVLGVFCTQDSQYPVTVQAKSGIMTVHYKSGGESKGGFNATVSVFSCPSHCPHECVKGHCVCPEGTTGNDCSDILCPNNCSAHLSRGVCDKGYGRCICSDGWGSPNCSIRLDPTRQLIFTELFNSAHLSDSLEHLRKMLPRFGHSFLSDRRNSLWLFGGYSLSHGPLNDIRLFDTKNNTWMQVTIDSTNDANMPRGRYFHAAEISLSRREIFIHGGLTVSSPDSFGVFGVYDQQGPKQNTVLDDFWKFSLKNQHWIDIQSNPAPPGLAGHTITLRRHEDSETLILIGGINPDTGFLDSVWEFDPASEKWEKLRTSGDGPIGIYGHSTVYHEPSQSFYVFGGYVFGINHTHISHKLYALNFPSKTWSVLPTFPKYNPPRLNLPEGRFLHSAVTTDDYMLIFGGRTESSSTPEPLVAYSYACNHWIKLFTKGVQLVGNLPPATYAHSMTLDVESTEGQRVVAYVMGGFTGGTDSHVTKISLPADLCALWATKDKCRLLLGCSYCSASNSIGGGTNSSYCFSTERHFQTDPCQNHNGTLRTSNGVSCDANWMAARSCDHFTTCTDCLAQWPTHWNQPQVCKWCGGQAKCVSVSKECSKDPKCGSKEIYSVQYCPELSCPASDCEKCNSLGNCTWTRQVMKTTDESSATSSESKFDWNCIPSTNYKLVSDPVCPQRCSQHTDCQTCLQSQGGEGDWHECKWSTRLSECISPSYQNLVCAGSVCGLVLSKGSHCPQSCSTFTKCSDCLKHAHCGWCSLDTANNTGLGVCSEGSLDQPAARPEYASCEVLYSQIVNKSESGTSLVDSGSEKFSWHYVTCPPENECENGHHNCDLTSEMCVDLLHGYQCICGRGYKSSSDSSASVGGDCVPVCSQGCVRGKCTSPDTCSCDFGYVGSNCSIQCQCNGHSHCAGPDKLDQCLECKNNTQGPTCNRCKPLFVGDPTDNGVCVPCEEYCNGHTDICVNDTIQDLNFIVEFTREELEKALGEGPTIKAKCINCANKTTGDKCEECIVGNFRGSEDHRKPCRPCECHGHGHICNPVTGEGCDCHNNTESDPTCSSKSQACWNFQCSKCKDSFMGTPTGGHQCYKQISVDTRSCLDATPVDDADLKPSPLNPGQAVFFAVQPRFMNVDIRITIDITQGMLDLFISPKDDTFVVDVNATNGNHIIKLDPRYRNGSESALEFGNCSGSNTAGWCHLHHTGSAGPVKVDRLEERSADGLFSTYITLEHKTSVLYVRKVTDRLVITLPHDKHDLGQTRFYIALLAVSSPTYGTIFFRVE
ncbi:multiple EGF like domains 8 isoform X2 [Rhodnius prolixus]|uniref:multiple EGF like domains 8 isoform X2 n=1 Tax=Rhodnius prolixus TaxID=13249 RepID=UPI003D1891E4